MGIHKEGRRLLLVLAVILIAINYGVIATYQSGVIMQVVIGLSIILFLLVLQFFRNPHVVVIQSDKKVLAPADGKVVVIEEVREEEYFKAARTQVSIFMSPVNVHVNRNPVSGLISYFKYHPGKYLVAWHPKSSTENERTTVVVKMGNDLEVMFRQIAGAVARRIKYYVKEGDEVEQGNEFGFIKFGSRVDILLPAEFQVNVNIGDKTKAGRTVIAELKD